LVIVVLRHRAGGAAVPDGPARFLAWVVGLLATERQEWGQAMAGELDRLEGRRQRWRFALGCATAALVMPPWGRAGAVVGTLATVASVGGGVVVYSYIHYGLGTGLGTWLSAVVLVAVLGGSCLAAGALARRPGVAGPGFAGGLVVAAAWLAVSGVTFTRFLQPITHFWVVLVVALLVPGAVGVAASLWARSDVAGRRIARLAAVSAGLSLYLYGVVAVAVVGPRAELPSPGWTSAAMVSDMLSNQIGFGLLFVPLATATVGWAAASATARLCTWQPGQPARLDLGGAAARRQPLRAALLGGVVLVAAGLAFVSWQRI
jgi:hypothetical protein